MGKGDRIRERNARERIAFQQAAARKAEARRRAFLAFGSILAVLAVVVVLIVVKNLQKPAKAAADVASAQQTVQQKITSVPAAAFNTVGKGTASPLVPTKGKLPVLMSGGKPEILYVGAEYCPYCAAERWAMTAALSRFGTFSGLHFIHSSSTDVYPSTPTLTFYKSTYTSKYVDFEPVELEGTTEGVALQTPTSAQSALFEKYDAPPYVPSADKGAFPFVDFGNQYLIVGAQYIPSDLSKLTWAQVATDMRNPASKVGQDIDGAANSITAAICKITKDAPAAVCTSPAAKAGGGLL
jgi:thiol-disulfide isomerase/thioredoxin